MGWASAGAIFDPVAQALVDLDADEHTKRKVLGPLIDALQDGDWDTEDESLEQFRDDPVIVSLFYQRNVGGQFDGDGADGVIGYDDSSGEWTLGCDGRAGHGELARRPGDSVAGHDELVRLWAEHERDQHDGSGEVADWALIDRGAVR
jgi:hypothetical protein